MGNWNHSADYAAVLHILSAPLVARRTTQYVAEDGFDWAALLAAAKAMSGGENLLVRAAHDLCEARPTVGLWELPRRLDSANFERVVDALYICHAGSPRRPRAGGERYASGFGSSPHLPAPRARWAASTGPRGGSHRTNAGRSPRSVLAVSGCGRSPTRNAPTRRFQ